MRAVFSIFVGVMGSLVAVSALSHHSFAAEFDVNRPVELTGTVTKIEWTNPHAWIYVDAEDNEGDVQTWAVELLGINTLLRSGWTPDRVKAGDVVVVEGFGARDGSNTANASTVTMATTGERLWETSSER